MLKVMKIAAWIWLNYRQQLLSQPSTPKTAMKMTDRNVSFHCSSLRMRTFFDDDVFPESENKMPRRKYVD